MEGLALSVESPVLLSADSRRRLQLARKNLRESHTSSRYAHEGDDVDDVLERAYEEGGSHLRPEHAPLSFKLRKLWSERGAFSKFRASSLPASDGGGEGNVDGEEKTAADRYDLGADLEGLVDEAAGSSAEANAAGRGDEPHDDGQTSSTLRTKDVMSIQDMLQLRSKMLERLGVAQHSLFFSHALVSLLLNSTKADQGSASNPSVARAGSPNSASAGIGGAAAGLRGETAASTSVLQRSGTAANVMGSAANLEAELGIEANVFGASRLEAERRDFGAGGEGDEEDNESDDDDGEEDLSREARRHQKQDRALSESERRETVETLVDCIQAKKQGLRGAANILRRGAAALRGDEMRNKSEKLRWQTLSQAKRDGWGLVADKPVRGTSNQKRELLEDGNRKRDEPARDAWIGYAIPEAQSTYRKRSLAYVSHDTRAATSTAKVLSFASRSEKTLQVQFIHGEDIWTSGREVNDEDSLNGQLSRAQCEMFDAELFDSIVGECRTMASSSSHTISFSDQDSVSMWLGNVELRISLVSNTEEEGKSPSSGLASGVRALLRLGLIRKYRNQTGASGKPKQGGAAVAASGKSSNAGDEGFPLLLPVIGPIQYTIFLTRLRAILEKVTNADPRLEYELRGLEKIQDGWAWLSTLLQGADEKSSNEAVEDLGGSAIIKTDGRLVALLSIAYPSQISLTMPAKVNALGDRGVHLSRVDLLALEKVLSTELA